MGLKILGPRGLCLPLDHSRTIEPEVPQQLQCVLPTRPAEGREEKERKEEKIPYILFRPIGI